MRLAKGASLTCFAVMAGVLLFGFSRGDFRKEGAQLVRMPWGIVSLFDVYVGFTLFSGWVVYREKALARSIPWVVAVMTLGNLVTSLYTFIALQTSGGSWRRFWLGNRAEG